MYEFWRFVFVQQEIAKAAQTLLDRARGTEMANAMI